MSGIYKSKTFNFDIIRYRATNTYKRVYLFVYNEMTTIMIHPGKCQSSI